MPDNRWSWLLVISIVLAFSGCAALKPKVNERDAATLPVAYQAAAGERVIPAEWWLDFDSPELTGLMENALAGNLSLVQAEARLRQAQATAKKSGAALWPEISGTAGAGRTRVHSKSDASEQTTTTDEYSLGLAASYELDLWGRVRSSRNSSALLAQASVFDYATVGISLAGSISENWLVLVQLKARLALLREQLVTNKQSLELLELRRLRGQATALDVYEQEQIVAATEVLIPQAENQVTLLEHQLAVLCGWPPEYELGLEQTDLPEMPILPSAGLPVDLLTNRPDIQAAWQRLESAQWAVAAARADRLPALRLSGAATYSSDELDSLFDNWILNLAGSLTAPLIDGGRRSAEVARTRAVADERLAAYRETVLNAVREVEDALVTEQSLHEQVQAQTRQLEAARNALSEARQRYRKGLSDYLRVLAALTTAQRLERDLVSLQQQLLANRVALYRALGTTWVPQQITL